MINSNLPSFVIEQHYESRDLAVRRLVDLYKDDFNINDKDVFYSVLARYGLLDNGIASDNDMDYIIKEVNRLIK